MVDGHGAAMPQSPSNRIDTICDQFEIAWNETKPPDIADYLDLGDSVPESRRDLLCRLVAIDLEQRWRLVGVRDDAIEPTLDNTANDLPWRSRLSDYVDRYPDLGPIEDLPAWLVCHEYRVRHLWGDRPDQDEYLRL